MNPMMPPEEKRFLQQCSHYPTRALFSVPEAKQEGFEYFFTVKLADRQERKKVVRKKMRSVVKFLPYFINYVTLS